LFDVLYLSVPAAAFAGRCAVVPDGMRIPLIVEFAVIPREPSIITGIFSP
jgi:hypothetical protein